MEQNAKYFEKTATALQNLNKEIEALNVVAEAETKNTIALKETVDEYKTALRCSAEKIDSIIASLNGALK